MNILKPWNSVFLVGFVVFVGIRHSFINRTKHETKTVSRMDSMEKILLAAMFPPTMLLPLVYLFTAWLAFADYGLPLWVPWLGAATSTANTCAGPVGFFRASGCELEGAT